MKMTGRWIGACLLLFTTFQALAATQFSSADYSLYPGDFNHDGRTDLLFVGKTPDKPSGIALADSSGNPQFGFQTWPANYLNVPWSDGTYIPIVADFNGDGCADVLLQRQSPGNHYLLFANCDSNLGPVGQILGISQTIGQTAFNIAWSADTHRLVAGDFNGDGYSDLFFQATAPSGSNAIVLASPVVGAKGFFDPQFTGTNYCGYANGPQQCWTDGYQGFKWSTKNSFVYAGNFGGDSKADLLLQARPDIVLIDYDIPIPIPRFRPQAFGILLAQGIDGPGTIFRSVADLWNWNERGSGSAPANWSPLNTNLVIGDFDGDGYADILLQSKSGGRPNVLVKANASGTGQVQVAVSVASNVAAWSGNSYQLLTGRFGNSSSAVLYLQSTSPGGLNYYTSSIVTGSVSAFASSFSVSPAQPVTPTAAGATAATASVSETGAASYSIPIQVPRGTADLTPKLALSYSQSTGNGLYGIGWGLSGLSIITRCPKTLAQDNVTSAVQLVASDEYCIDGNRLRRVSAAGQGADGSQYRTELETYSLITAKGTGVNGPSWFEVKRKDGLIYEYGNSTDARVPVTGSSTTRVWALSRVKDRAGNYIDFTYYNDTTNGSYRPRLINYTGNANTGTAPAYTIEFFDEARGGENVVSYYRGGLVNQTRRINRIEVRYGATIVRKYILGYVTAPTASAFSRLDTIQECGASSCLGVTKLHWSDQELDTYGFSARESTARPAPQYQQFPAYGAPSTLDFNGDGVADTITAEIPPLASGPVPIMILNLGARHGQSAPASTQYNATNHYDIPFGTYDWDGDGKDDFLVMDSTTYTFWYLHQRSDGTVAYENTGVAYGNGANTLMDVDGDGYKDLVRVDPTTSHVYVRFHSRVSAVGLEGEIDAWGAPSGTIAFATVGGQSWSDKTTRSVLTNADFDGDGRQDLIIQVNNGWRVLYSNGAGFTSGELIVSKLQPGGLGYVMPTSIDVNGDGCTDLVYPSNVSSPVLQLAMSRCLQSSGVGFVTPVSTGISVAPNGFRAVVVDWNLDGYQDLMFEGKIATSLGTGFATPAADGSQVDDSRADLDGDGVPDFVQACGCSSYSSQFYAAKGPKPNLLLSVTDGLENAIAFTYAPLTDPSVYTRGTGSTGSTQDLNGTTYVVSRMTSTDGVGSTYGLNYHYEQARRNIQGRGFLGFGKRTITDTRTGSVTEETYDQSAAAGGVNWEKAGRLTSRKIYQYSNGPLIREETYTNSSFAPTDATSSRYVYVSLSLVKDYELNNGVNPVKTVTTTTYVDNYGTPYDLQTTILEGVTGLFPATYATLRMSIPSGYVTNNVSDWCLSKPRKVEDTRSHTQDKGDLLTRTTTQEWNTQYCRLTDKTVEPGAQQLATHFDYDSFNNINKTTITGTGLPVSGLVTETYWGPTGQLPQWIKNPKLQQTGFTWDYSLGLKKTETDPNSRVTTNWYDDLGRVTRVQRHDGTSTRFTYFICNASNNYCGDRLLRMTVKTAERDTGDTFDVSYRYTYLDSLGRKKYEQRLAFNGGLSTVQTMYDPRGNVASQSMPYYASTNAYSGVSYTYDLLNRVTRTDRPVSDADRSVQSEFVNYNGLTVTRVDANGGGQTEISSAWGRVVRMVDQAGANTNYTYNSFGELRTVTDPLSNVSTLTYNARGFKDSQIDPDLGSWGFTYDALGRMLTQTDAKAQTTSFTYDELSRMKTRTDYGKPVTTWNWDTAANGIGQIGSIVGPDGAGLLDASHSFQETYAYDSAGRQSSVTTQETAIGSYAVDYGYDPSLATLKTITYPTSTSGRFAVQYGYQNGYLKDVRELITGTPLLWQANDQDARGHIIQESYGNGQQTYLDFDETSGRLSYLQTGPSGGAATQNLSYTWDRIGNLTSRRDANQSLTESFTYDSVNRLTETRLNGTLTQTTGYNAIGNITSKGPAGAALTYTYPSSGTSSVRPHAVSSVGATPYIYDANGNMTSRNGATVTWTTFNYPMTINESGGNYSTFYYAPDRSKYRQVAKTGTTIEDRVYIGAIFEKTTSGSTIEYRHYIVANGKAVAVRKRVSATEETYYLHEDHLGSTDAITTQAGAKLVQLSYGAWGDRRGSGWSGVPSPSDITAINSSTHRGFTQQEQLDNLGLVHLNGRVYDATIGRFVSADPIVQDPYHSQSFNRYSYVWNNPLNATDPTGFVTCTGSHIQYNKCVDWQTGQTVAADQPKAGTTSAPVASQTEGPTGSAQQTATTAATGAASTAASADGGEPQSSVTVTGTRSSPDSNFSAMAASVARTLIPNVWLLQQGRIQIVEDAEARMVTMTVSASIGELRRGLFPDTNLERIMKIGNSRWSLQFQAPNGIRYILQMKLSIAATGSDADLQFGNAGSAVNSGSVAPGQRSVFLRLGISDNEISHELGHPLGLPDQYEARVVPFTNFVLWHSAKPGFEGSRMADGKDNPNLLGFELVGLIDRYRTELSK